MEKNRINTLGLMTLTGILLYFGYNGNLFATHFLAGFQVVQIGVVGMIWFFVFVILHHWDEIIIQSDEKQVNELKQFINVISRANKPPLYITIMSFSLRIVVSHLLIINDIPILVIVMWIAVVLNRLGAKKIEYLFAEEL